MTFGESFIDKLANKLADSLSDQQCSFVMTTEDYEQLGASHNEDWYCQQPAYKNDRCIWHADYRTKDWGRIRSGIPNQSAVEGTPTEVYENGEGGFSINGLRLDGADFSNFTDNNGSFFDCSLIGARFVGSNFDLYSFRQYTTSGHIDLRGADFSDSNLDCNFQGANLQRARFDGAEISEHTSFEGADLRGATFEATELPPAENFKGAIVEEGANWLDENWSRIFDVLTLVATGAGAHYARRSAQKSRRPDKMEQDDYESRDSDESDRTESVGGFVFDEQDGREDDQESS